MADDINKKITVDVQVNTDAQRQIDQYKTSFDSLRKSITNLGKPISDLSSNIDNLTKSLSGTSEKGISFKKVFDDVKGSFQSWKDIIKVSVKDLTDWTNIVSAGLAIITNYGPAIANWYNSLIYGQDALSKTKLSADALNNALASSDYSKVIEQFDELKINIGLARQGFISKTAVVNQYNNTLGQAIGKASDLNGVENVLVKNGDAYIKMTLYKAAAQLALHDAAKKVYEAEQARLKSDGEALTFWDKMADFSNQSGGISAPGVVPNSGFIKQHEQANKLRHDMAEKRRLDEEKEAKDKSKALFGVADNFLKEAAKIAKNSGFNFFTGQITNSGNIKQTNDDLRQGLSEAEKMRLDSLVRQLQATNQFYSASATAEGQRYNDEKARLDKLLSDKKISKLEYNKVLEQLESEHQQKMLDIVKKYKDEDMTSNQEAQNQFVIMSKGIKDIENKLAEIPVVAKDIVTPYIKQRTAEEIKAIQDRADFEIQTTQKVSDTAFSILSKGLQSRSDAKIKSLESDKAKELSNTSLTSVQKQAIEAKYKKQEGAVRLKAFKAEQKTSIAQAIINGAIAITKAEAQTGVLGAFVIPGIIAQTAIQVATIAAQKPPALAKGGYFQSDGKGAMLPGYSRTDNTNAYLRSGEAVVVSEAMRDPWARNLVSAINVAYGGRDFSISNPSHGYAIGGIFTDGGNANRYYNQPVTDQKNLANTIAYQMINNFPPVYVDVKDINNQQNILAQTVNRVNL